MDFTTCANCTNKPVCDNYYAKVSESYCTRKKNNICIYGMPQELADYAPVKINLKDNYNAREWLTMINGKPELVKIDFSQHRNTMRLFLPYSLPIIFYGIENATHDPMIFTQNAFNTELRFYDRAGYQTTKPFGNFKDGGINNFLDLHKMGFNLECAYINPGVQMLKADFLMDMILAKELSDLNDNNIPMAVTA